jgi:ABC-2 type transport system permease protein
MNIRRIWGVVTRHMIQLPQDFNKWSSILFWPLLDIILFGYTAMWLENNETQSFTILLTGVVFWQILVRANFGVSINFLEEIWSQNITNLFASPLTIGEWIVAVMIDGIIMINLTLVFCAGIAFWGYDYNIFALGWALPALITMLYLSGLAMGFLATSILVIWGPRVQALIFIMGYLFAPISGAFYPVSMMPTWVQYLALSSPLMYIFNTMRNTITHNAFPWYEGMIGLGLSVCYVIAAIAIFIRCFAYRKSFGLDQLID